MGTKAPGKGEGVNIKKPRTFKTGERENRKSFSSAGGGVFNPIPCNEEECSAHSNALAATGYYPVRTSECFNIGISGGCGLDCFVYQKGECPEPQEIDK